MSDEKKSEVVKSIVKRMSETDSRAEYYGLQSQLVQHCMELWDLVDKVCKRVGTHPLWQPMIDAFDQDKIDYSFKYGSPHIFKAEISCYGTRDVEFFSITASDGTIDNEIPIELPWFDLGEDGWFQLMRFQKRDELEKDVASAEIKLQLAKDRLERFCEKHYKVDAHESVLDILENDSGDE